MNAPREFARWESFDGFAWAAFCGSERAADGAEPKLAEIVIDGHDAIAVVDANGCGVWLVVDEADFEWAGSTLRAFDLPAATTRRELEKLGFRKV